MPGASLDSGDVSMYLKCSKKGQDDLPASFDLLVMFLCISRTLC